jgi:hypothetical protein
MFEAADLETVILDIQGVKFDGCRGRSISRMQHDYPARQRLDQTLQEDRQRRLEHQRQKR